MVGLGGKNGRELESMGGLDGVLGYRVGFELYIYICSSYIMRSRVLSVAYH